jgi:predicted PurR-regulated permease PerM
MSVASVYLVLIAALLAIPIITVPPLVTQVNALINRTPEYLDQLGVVLSRPVEIGPFEIPLDEYPILDQIYANVSSNFVEVAQTIGRQSVDVLTSVAGATLTTLGWIVIVLVLSFYMITDYGRLFSSMVEMIPAAHRGDMYRLGNEISATWHAFLRGQLLLCLTIGIVTFILALIIGLPNALALALIAGIAEFIPNVGPILAAIPAVLIAFFQYDSSWLGAQLSPLVYTVIVLVMYILIQQVENIVLVPRIIGRSLGLQPIVVFVGAIAGASVAGILGILLAAPVLATARLILVYIMRKLADEPPFPLNPNKDADKNPIKQSQADAKDESKPELSPGDVSLET